MPKRQSDKTLAEMYAGFYPQLYRGVLPEGGTGNMASGMYVLKIVLEAILTLRKIRVFFFLKK